MEYNEMDDITIWLREQDERGCHEAADALESARGGESAALEEVVRLREMLEVKTADYLATDGLRLVACAQRDCASEEVARLSELLQECVEPLMCLGDEELARRIRKEVE